jgi:hypothetical protein
MCRRLVVAGITSLVMVAISAPARAATLVADWRMNEPSGSTVMNDSATADGAQNGTITGDVVLDGARYEFSPNGGAGYVTVPDDPVLDPGDQNLSFTARVTISEAPVTDFNVFRKGTGRQQHYKMEVVQRPRAIRVRCLFRGSNGPAVAITKGNIQVGIEYGLRCTKTASTIELHINEQQSFTKPASVGSIANDNPLVIARNEDGDDQLIGFMNMLTVSTG